MDPISMIVSALVAGAAASAEKTASQAVKDAYDGLKQLIKAKFKNDSHSHAALSTLEREPAEARPALEKALRAEVSVDEQDDAVKAAARLLQLLPEARGSQAKFSLHTNTAQGVVQGDNANVSMSFGPQKTSK